jgi:CBS domain-containing protein
LEQILYSVRDYSLGMREHMLITEIVRRSDMVVHAQDRISGVYRLMKRDRLMHIPVMDQGKITGVIGRKNIQRLGFGYTYDGLEDVEMGMFDMLQVDQVMDKDLPLVALDATIWEVGELMATQVLEALPVVHEGKLVGLIDINDILLFLLKGH